jgi:hypothetical protein
MNQYLPSKPAGWSSYVRLMERLVSKGGRCGAEMVNRRPEEAAMPGSGGLRSALEPKSGMVPCPSGGKRDRLAGTPPPRAQVTKQPGSGVNAGRIKPSATGAGSSGMLCWTSVRCAEASCGGAGTVPWPGPGFPWQKAAMCIPKTTRRTAAGTSRMAQRGKVHPARRLLPVFTALSFAGVGVHSVPAPPLRQTTEDATDSARDQFSQVNVRPEVTSWIPPRSGRRHGDGISGSEAGPAGSGGLPARRPSATSSGQRSTRGSVVPRAPR